MAVLFILEKMEEILLMRLESLSSMAEITPYYGTLDEVFRLMNTLWMKTRNIWNKSKIQIQRDVERKSISWGISNPIRYDLLIKNQLTLMLFEDVELEAQNEAEYETLINLIDEVKEPEMICTLCLYLSPTRDFDITLETYKEYQDNNDLNLIELYNQTIKKMKEKRMNCSKVWSYVFAEELPSIYGWEFIKIVIFVWTDSSQSDNFIQVWNQYRKSSQCEIGRIYLVWIGMSSEEFNKLLSSIDHSVIKIISSYKHRSNLINDIINLDLPLNKSFLVDIWSDDQEFMINNSHDYLML